MTGLWLVDKRGDAERAMELARQAVRLDTWGSYLGRLGYLLSKKKP